MGLDMYLTGRKFLVTDWDNPTADETEDGFRIEEKLLRLGYWRKHPNLHGFIVQTFADGRDECQEIELSAEHLDTIIAAVKAKALPATTGFFFGQSSGDDDEIADDIKILEGAKAWLAVKDKKSWRSIVYRASW